MANYSSSNKKLKQLRSKTHVVPILKPKIKVSADLIITFEEPIQ